MPLEEIRAGMEGVARTVFEADAMEEFRVEILGVLRNAIGPGHDMILARLKGEKVEFTGVVSGMSGSPVYIDGRLVGAIAYRLGPFAKEAIAGITPIHDMLGLSGAVPPSDAARVAPAPHLLGEFLAGGIGVDSDLPGGPGPVGDPEPAEFGLSGSIGAPGHAGGPGLLPGAAATGLRPIGTPLVCSGCDPEVLAYYAPIFRSRGLEPMSGGGSTGGESRLGLTPGSPIGAAMVLGDISVTGIGTLTAVDGGRVYGFGHGFLGVGPLEIPMTQAQILATYPSAATSFKIANTTEPVGAIIRDGLTAVVGEVGRVPPTIPLDVSVASGDRLRPFHYDILSHRAWSPVMVALVTANSLVRTTEFDASASLGLRYRIDIEGRPPVEMEDLFSGPNPAQPVHAALANRVGSVFGLLTNNRFEPPPVRGLEIAVEILREAQVASVTALHASRTLARPGERLTITSVLTPFRGEPREIAWEVELPEDTPRGDLHIVVGGGPAIDGLERRIRQRQMLQAGSLSDLVRLIVRRRRSRTLYLRFTRRAPSAIVRSELLPDLPLSVFTVFNHRRLSSDTTLISDAPILELSRDLDLVAVGGRRITIKVR
ncbi:MAG: SpoIVB peptidase S55 domain-containing protein [Acidobacteriota bacterium]